MGECDIYSMLFALYEFSGDFLQGRAREALKARGGAFGAAAQRPEPSLCFTENSLIPSSCGLEEPGRRLRRAEASAFSRRGRVDRTILHLRPPEEASIVLLARQPPTHAVRDNNCLKERRGAYTEDTEKTHT